MSGQRRWIKVWARTVGMPVGSTDEDKPEFLPISQQNVRLALAKMRLARDQGRFKKLSDEEFKDLIDEFTSDPSNFTPAKRRAISIKYDKDLQKDIADRKGISTDDVKAKMSDFQSKFEEQQLEEWTKRQWQLRAGIIK